MKSLGTFVVGLLAGAGVLCLGALLYLRFGPVPVAVADAPFPFEQKIAHAALGARIDRQRPAASPVPLTTANLVQGATVYRAQCAFCHGMPGQPSQVGRHMYPSVPQLWEGHGHGVVGVSDDPVGETYWKVRHGIRLSGMPAYEGVLREEQMWDVSLLVQSADKPMPPAVEMALQR